MKRILVLLPNNLGDVIMATPLLAGLRKKYPASLIAFFVEKGFEAPLEHHPFCDLVITFDRRSIKSELNSAVWSDGLNSVTDLVAELNSQPWDEVHNLCQHPYVSYLASLIQTARRTGQYFLPAGNHAIDDDWSQYLYAVAFARRCNMLHVCDIYARIMGIKKQMPANYVIEIDESENERAKEYLLQKGILLGSEKIALFQPGSALPSKKWPARHFVTLGKLLRGKGWQILISGAPAEQSEATHIAREIGSGCFVTAGETSFGEAMAIARFATVCVTGDTALMHAASGLGVTVYALFGATSPLETGPYATGNWIFCGKCAERPCFKTTCDNPVCMESILPQTVFDAINNTVFASQHSCDIFKTAFDNGEYSLVAYGQNSGDYFDVESALLTGRMVEPARVPDGYEVGDENRKIIEGFIAGLNAMLGRLNEFQQTRNSEAIRAFELEKDRLKTACGLGAFLAAMLNLRLNSVPLLDPVEGIRRYVEHVTVTISQIQSLLKKQQ